MTLPAYVDIPDTDADQDSPLKSGDYAETLRDNVDARRRYHVYTDEAEQTETSESFQAQFSIRVPIESLEDYPSIQRRIVADVHAWVSPGGGGEAGEVRLRDFTTGNVGAAVAVTETTDTHKYPTLDVPVGWASTTRQIEVQTRITSSGTIHVRADDRQSWKVES